MTLQPGVYCGGMSFSGPVNVTFAPGLYMIKDGVITETGGTFTGNGVVPTTVAANTQALAVTGLSRNTQYWFRIRANAGNFVFTAWVNATPFPILTTP